MPNEHLTMDMKVERLHVNENDNVVITHKDYKVSKTVDFFELCGLLFIRDTPFILALPPESVHQITIQESEQESDT